jgi:hypothetical protein
MYIYMTGTNGATTTTISDKWLQATQLCVASGPLSASSQTRNNSCRNIRCCYITVDSAFAASQNGFCSYKQYLHIRIPTWQKLYIFITYIFYHRSIVKFRKYTTLFWSSVTLWCSRCKICRNIGAPEIHIGLFLFLMPCKWKYVCMWVFCAWKEHVGLVFSQICQIKLYWCDLPAFIFDLNYFISHRRRYQPEHTVSATVICTILREVKN